MRVRVLSTFAVNTPLARLGARSCELVDAASSVVDKLGVTRLYARVGGVERSGEFLLMELELIEPVLFLGLGAAVERPAQQSPLPSNRRPKLARYARDRSRFHEIGIR
jgi:hypothetical protein